MRETGGEFAYDRLPHLTGHPTHLIKTDVSHIQDIVDAGQRLVLDSNKAPTRDSLRLRL